MSSSVKRLLAGFLAALLLLTLSGCSSKKTPEAPELLEPKGVTLDTAAVRRGTIQTVKTYEGLVLPAVRELSFAVSGVMTGVNVCAGSRVKAGQELASLDVSRYVSALESMESYLAFADENEAIIEREQEIQIELAKLALAGVLAAALLLLPLSGCGGKKEPPAPELLEPKGVTLDTATVRRGSIQTVTAYEGLVLPAVRELSFAVSGVMTGVNVCTGSRVKAGQELASLDVGRYTAALESMESYLAYAEENEAIIEREQEIQIELARLALEEQRSAGAGRNTLRLAELKIEEQESSLAETRALWELDRAEQVSSIEEMRAMVESSRLLAPCDGTIVSCNAADGGYAMENMAVIWLAEDAELYLSVAAVSAAALSEADEVYATVAGKRVEVAPRSVGEGYLLRAGMSAFDVTDPGEAKVESGMSAVLFVISDRVEDALIVPSSAVYYDFTYFVYKVVDGVQVRQNVQRGVANDAEVQILSGLQEGDVVYAGA